MPFLVLVVFIHLTGSVTSQPQQPSFLANGAADAKAIRYVATATDFVAAIRDESRHIVLTQHLHLGGLTDPISILKPTLSVQVRCQD
jgi:hypothetical protein